MMGTFCHTVKVFSMLVQFYHLLLLGAVTRQKYVAKALFVEVEVCEF